MTGTLQVKGVLRRADAPDEIKWDTDDVGGPLDPKYARAEFDRIVKANRWAFAFAEVVGGEREQIRLGEFDPNTQTKVVVAPHMAGGC